MPNPLDSKGNSATSNTRAYEVGTLAVDGWAVYIYIWYSLERPGLAVIPLSPLLAVPNVTAHPLAASVPLTVLQCDSPLLCGFNMAIKELKYCNSNSNLAILRI